MTDTPEAHEVEALAADEGRLKVHLTERMYQPMQVRIEVDGVVRAQGYILPTIGEVKDFAQRDAALVARVKAEACEQVADEMREQAVLRFDQHGPRDARGAAFWDVYTGLTEGRIARAEGATS